MRKPSCPLCSRSLTPAPSRLYALPAASALRVATCCCGRCSTTSSICCRESATSSLASRQAPYRDGPTRGAAAAASELAAAALSLRAGRQVEGRVGPVHVWRAAEELAKLSRCTPPRSCTVYRLWLPNRASRLHPGSPTNPTSSALQPCAPPTAAAGRTAAAALPHSQAARCPTAAELRLADSGQPGEPPAPASACRLRQGEGLGGGGLSMHGTHVCRSLCKRARADAPAQPSVATKHPNLFCSAPTRSCSAVRRIKAASIKSPTNSTCDDVRQCDRQDVSIRQLGQPHLHQRLLPIQQPAQMRDQ